MKSPPILLSVTHKSPRDKYLKKTENSQGPLFGGGGVQSGECATSGEEVTGSISAVAARSLLVGSVQYNVTD